MPESDEDGPFVTALVVSPKRIDDVGRRFRSIKWVARTISEFEAHPSITYVKPEPGFAKRWLQKTEKMKTMARARKLVTGEGSYLAEGGMRPRNQVWFRAMHLGLTQAIIASVFRSAVSEIILVLDRKSLDEVTERFMRDRLDALIPDLRRNFLDQARKYPERTERMEECLRNLAATQVAFEWSTPKEQAGLWLSHHLGRLAFRELEGRNRESLFETLERVGYLHFLQDVTGLLTGPLSGRTVGRWKEETGLPVPEMQFEPKPGSAKRNDR